MLWLVVDSIYKNNIDDNKNNCDNHYNDNKDNSNN